MATIIQTYFTRYRRYYSLITPFIATEKARAYTMLTLSLFAMSFFGIFAINPTLTTIAELRKKVEDAELVQRQLQNKISNLSQLQKTYPTIEHEVPIIFDALPPLGRAANLLGKVNALAARYNIAFTSLQVQRVPLDSSKRNEATQFSITMSGTGSYENIYSLLRNLSTLDRIITIEQLTITKGTSEAKTRQLTFSLRGTAYILFE